MHIDVTLADPYLRHAWGFGAKIQLIENISSEKVKVAIFHGDRIVIKVLNWTSLRDST